MLVAIAIFGVLVCLGSLVGIVAPAKFIGVVRSVMDRPGVLYLAVIVRVALGVLLIAAAPVSRFPLLFLVFGWIAIAAALAIPFIGYVRMVRLMEWFVRMPAAAIRGWLIFGLAFGAFLIYGAGIV